MEKRGQVGLNTVKAVMLVLLILGIIGFTIIITMSNLNDSSAAQSSSGVTTHTNLTLVSVSEIGEDLTGFEFPDVTCSIIQIDALNGSGTYFAGADFAVGNRTVTNCNVAFAGNDTQFNDTDWNVTYSETHNIFQTTEQNITGGIEEFFSNALTWFALLAVVIIILIIAIVIIAVNRFGGGGRDAGL